MKRTLAGLGLAGLLLSGCGMQKAVEPFRDSPTSGDRNEAPARIITMPDGFSNIAGKCDGPNYVYSGYHGDDNRMSITVAPNDPRCKG